jgi:outer membrane receptor protein involved in Fe transport
VGPYTPTPWEDDKSSQTSEELRLTSSGNTKLKWLAGYFYSDFESEWNQTVIAPGAIPLFGSANGFTQVQPTKIIQNSFFGEISYQLTSQLKATAGLRRYSYNSGVHDNVSGFLSITSSDTVGHYSTEEHDQGVDPKFDLSYQVDKDLLLYVNAAKGFRPGGGNQPVPTSGALGAPCEANLQANHGTTSFVAAPLSFRPDSVWSYELGEKATGFDNRVSLNSAVYLETWNAVQQTIPLACGFLYTNNAGNARVYGAELEFNAILIPGLSLSASAAYMHATFVVGSVEAGVSPGTRVQNVPNATSSVSLAYRRSISNNLEFTSHIQNNYVGTRTDATYSINHLPSYDLTNVRAGVKSGERWTAVLFANNLFNKRAFLTDTSSVTINLPTYNRVAVSQPLTIGVDLSYHFGR